MTDLVIGIDASTTAVKAIAFRRDGTPVAEARGSYSLSTPFPGHVEQNPHDWWQALCNSLSELAGKVGCRRVAALAITHQRETFTLLDAEGTPLRPAILWLDERARPQVARLSRQLGHEQIRDWSGKPPDPTPAIYSIAWLSEHEPDVLKRASVLADVSTFLHHRLTGSLACSVASADPLGLLDLRKKNWCNELVGAAGLTLDQLPALAMPGKVIGHLTEHAARACGLISGTPVIAAAGDGQAAGLGLGVCEEGAAYLSLGSGVVSGMYESSFQSGDPFRTLIAPTGHGYMLETVLRSGMQLIEWVMRTTGTASPKALEEAAFTIEPGSSGLLMLPYLAGVMNPHWDEAARGAMIGLSLSHRPAHIFRAAIEGIAFEQRLATDAMEKAVERKGQSITACGGGTNSKLMLCIIASILGRRIAVSPVTEAAALGAGMIAAAGIGWYSSISEASRAMSRSTSDCVEPDSDMVKAYEPLRMIYAELYSSLRSLHSALHALKSG